MILGFPVILTTLKPKTGNFKFQTEKVISFCQIEHNLKNITTPFSAFSTRKDFLLIRSLSNRQKTISCTEKSRTYDMPSNSIKLKVNMDSKRLSKNVQYRPCRSKSRTIWINVSVNISQIQANNNLSTFFDDICSYFYNLQLSQSNYMIACLSF